MLVKMDRWTLFLDTLLKLYSSTRLFSYFFSHIPLMPPFHLNGKCLYRVLKLDKIAWFFSSCTKTMVLALKTVSFMHVIYLVV